MRAVLSLANVSLMRIREQKRSLLLRVPERQRPTLRPKMAEESGNANRCRNLGTVPAEPFADCDLAEGSRWFVNGCEIPAESGRQF